jgi:photosystem II stability/assembly factor-like uncharacterized protein
MNTIDSGIDIARRIGRRRPRRLPTGIAILALTLTVLFTAPINAEQGDAVEHSIQAPLAARSLMLDAVAVGDRLIAVGERGHILVSSDNGASWNQVAVPTRALLTGVAFADDTTGVAVGHDSVILRSTDRGDTWERVYWAPEDEAPFFDVWFADPSNGIATGAYGSYFVTSDGGETWDFEPVGDTDWHLHEIARDDAGRLFMVAEAGFVYRSDDGGVSWTELPSPYEGSYFGVLPLAGDSVLLFGLRGHLFRSDDAGESWQEIDTGTVAMLTSGSVLSDGTVVIVGLGGTVLVSTDGGATFSGYQQAGRRGISKLVETGDGSLLLVGEFGVRVAALAELTAEQ